VFCERCGKRQKRMDFASVVVMTTIAGKLAKPPSPIPEPLRTCLKSERNAQKPERSIQLPWPRRERDDSDADFKTETKKAKPAAEGGCNNVD
jgi:hypothetical protein